MSVQNDHQLSHSQAEDAWTDYGSDFVLIAEGKPPPRIELARERLLICRLYLGLMRAITDDYGAEFAAQSDSLVNIPELQEKLQRRIDMVAETEKRLAE
jgi:hypothetical protein